MSQGSHPLGSNFGKNGYLTGRKQGWSRRRRCEDRLLKQSRGPLKVLRDIWGRCLSLSISLPVCLCVSVCLCMWLYLCVCMWQMEGTLLLFSNPIWLLVRKSLAEKAATREQDTLSVHFQTVFLPRWSHSANIRYAGSALCLLLGKLSKIHSGLLLAVWKRLMALESKHPWPLLHLMLTSHR